MWRRIHVRICAGLRNGTCSGIRTDNSSGIRKRTRYKIPFRFCTVLLLMSFCAMPGVGTAQSRTDPWLDSLLRAAPDPLMKMVLDSPETYRLQIVYTRIDRDGSNRPQLRSFHWHTDPQLYFNPASTVKMPLAFLALEKLASLKAKGVDRNTFLLYDSSYSGQSVYREEPSAPGGKPSIAHEIRQVLLVSENAPYNRLYEFLGQQHINRSLHAKGYPDTRITRRFLGMTPEQNRHTNGIHFLDPQGRELYYQPPAYNPDSFRFPPPIKVGKAYIDRNDSLVQEPIDFTQANHITLKALHDILLSVMLPSAVPPSARFALNPDDRRFLLQYLSQFPGETNYPKYDGKVFYDSYVKFFFRDSTSPMPTGLRVFNKVGWAYGFLTDVSFIADVESGVEYMLAATLYVNRDGILNDDAYDYDEIGFPFMKALGTWIHAYEKTRPRARKPDLKDLRVRYEKQATDGRPTIKVAGND